MSLNTRSKIKSGGLAEQKHLRDISYYKLFMLNIHAVIEDGFRLERIFQDLQRKYEGDYIYGRMFIAESIIEIIETLDRVIFHLNALTEGGDIELYHILDNLKNRLNRCFEGDADADNVPYNGDNPPEKKDDLSILLGQIIDCSAVVSASAEASGFLTLEDTRTARDFLYYCYNRIFAFLDDNYNSIIQMTGEFLSPGVPIIGMPVSYLQQDERPVLENGLPFKYISDPIYSNPGVHNLTNGIYEILNSELYLPFLEESRKESDIRGTMFYSNETLALYNASKRFKFIIAANICEAVGGNYIDISIISAAPHTVPLSAHQLIWKLLGRLDFHTFSGYGFTTASIRNITRNEMENHLNMLGKLITFASEATMVPSDEGNVRRNIEIFLENVI